MKFKVLKENYDYDEVVTEYIIYNKDGKELDRISSDDMDEMEVGEHAKKIGGTEVVKYKQYLKNMDTVFDDYETLYLADSVKESFTDDRYEEIKSKTVQDSDGFWTDYTMYFDHNENKYVFVFGDKEMYSPEDGEFDWEEENPQAAEEWFDSYEWVVEDDLEESLNEEDVTQHDYFSYEYALLEDQARKAYYEKDQSFFDSLKDHELAYLWSKCMAMPLKTPVWDDEVYDSIHRRDNAKDIMVQADEIHKYIYTDPFRKDFIEDQKKFDESVETISNSPMYAYLVTSDMTGMTFAMIHPDKERVTNATGQKMFQEWLTQNHYDDETGEETEESRNAKDSMREEGYYLGWDEVEFGNKDWVEITNWDWNDDEESNPTSGWTAEIDGQVIPLEIVGKYHTRF